MTVPEKRSDALRNGQRNGAVILHMQQAGLLPNPAATDKRELMTAVAWCDCLSAVGLL